ncbi:AAA family ATPase [Poseidonocella sp. HB161398]|uniref:AAA family ATPase n=1 Tax=Poseidonocella sp. HB161398 TaxID=2320855 RepID=UPI001109652C|nr:AAA family ATPase [Poseidonocella sp. HB161398]
MTSIELDIASGELLCDGAAHRLRRKTLAVLVALMERQGEIVSQDELRQMIWGSRHGSDAGPKQCIRELRRLLEDSPGAPRFIETVGRQGYRLVAPIELAGGGALLRSGGALCVGRAGELSQLSALAETARRGSRAVAVIAGESGAGKTRLADGFLAGLPGGVPLWTARAQCIPHPGAREPYGPLIEILGQLPGGRGMPDLPALMREAAPSWLAQLPGPDRGAVPATALEPVPSQPDPMLREFSELMERLTQQLPGILVLEDLHWADPGTLDWLGSWVLRRAPSRLLVIATYRDEELESAAELAGMLHHLARSPGYLQLTLGGFDAAAVTAYLDGRFRGNAFPPELGAALAQRTEGHALLVDAVAGQWVQDGDIRQAEGRWTLQRPVAEIVARIAPGLRSLIAGELARLDPAELELLERAAVAGLSFSAAALADGRPGLEALEQRLERLARNRRFIERAGIALLPDGTMATRYAFRHALYQEAIYDSIPAATRQAMHLRTGRRLETVYGPRAAEIAPGLADHFERAADWPSAALHRGVSGMRALDRGAAPDAAGQLRRALAHHAACPPGSGPMAEAELRSLLGLGAALIVSEGFTAAELRQVYGRAALLARGAGDPSALVPVLAGLWNDQLSRAELDRAAELSDTMLELARGGPAGPAMAAANAAGQSRFFAGQISAALPYVDAVLGRLDGSAAAGTAAQFGEDPGVVCHQYAACLCQFAGDAAAAERHLQAGTARAEELGQPFGRAQMLWAGALVARERGEAGQMLEQAGALMALCSSAAIPFWLPYGQMLAGWAQARLGRPGGLALLRAGLEASAGMQVRLVRPYGLALFAEAAAHEGRPAEALGALAQALRLARRSGEGWYMAEILRLRGDLLACTGRREAARHALEAAAGLARRQGAASFEARARARLAAMLP